MALHTTLHLEKHQTIISNRKNSDFIEKKRFCRSMKRFL